MWAQHIGIKVGYQKQSLKLPEAAILDFSQCKKMLNNREKQKDFYEKGKENEPKSQRNSRI